MSRRHAALPRPSPDAPSAASTELRWQQLFGTPAPSRIPSLLEQAIAWKEQALAHGDVSPAIQRDLRIVADEVASRRAGRQGPDDAQHEPSEATTSPAQVPNSSSARISRRSGASRTNSRTTPLPPASSQLLPGTRLVKLHGGMNHVVEVEAEGFRYEGELFGSLSAVAKHITGTHWNGLLFFGLRKRRTYPAKARAHD